MIIDIIERVLCMVFTSVASLLQTNLLHMGE